MSLIDYSSRRKATPSASESTPESHPPLQVSTSEKKISKHPNDSQQQSNASTSLSLSRSQRGYLLKALVTIQMTKEGSDLEKLGTLTAYGSPFSKETSKSIKTNSISSQNNQSQDELFKGDFEGAALNDSNVEKLSQSSDFGEPLILRQLFHKNLLPFPGLNKAPKKYFVERIQVFFDEMAARNFSTSLERSEMAKRHFFLLAGLRYLSNFFTRGVGLRGEGELKGPGKGVPGSEKWEVGKQWGKGTVKRGLSHPIRPNADLSLSSAIESLFSDPEEKKFWSLASKEVQRIRINWCGFKESIIEDLDGLDEVIKVLDVASLNNIPKKYRYAEEFVRIHVAFILHTLFITSEDSASIFNIVKGFNTFFPWLGARALLKFVNAGYVVEGILKLILARPLGAPSLLQRFMSFVINSEIDKIKKESQKPLEKEINDKILLDKLDDYVSKGDRNLTKKMATLSQKNGDDILTTILLYFEPQSLDQSKPEEIKEMQVAFAKSDYRLKVDLAYPDSSEIGKANLKRNLRGSSDKKARKFAQLKLYLRSALRLRDHQQALKVASGTLVVMILKDSLTLIFYQLIKDVASVANLSGRLADLHNFLDDLVKVRNGNDKSLEAWIALAARHEQSLYTFAHECRSLAPQFMPFLQSALDFMALSTSDPLNPSDQKVPRIEVNLEDLLSKNSSEINLDEVMKEIDDLETYVKWQKVRSELELRKNFLCALPPSDSTSQIPANSVPHSMKTSLQDVDSLLSQLMKSQNFTPNEGTLVKGGRGSEQEVYDWAWFDGLDLFGSQLTSGLSENQRYSPKNVSAPLPQLIEVRKLLPSFRKILKEKMPRYE